MRTECGAIGEILNAIAGFLPPNSPTSSGRTCTNGYVHLERLEKSQTQP